MLELVFQIVVCVFAVYGALSLILSIFYSLNQKPSPDNPGIKTVFMVKNQEDTIEGILRNFIAVNDFHPIIPNRNLTVIDLGSSDDTVDILFKLREDHEFIDVIQGENQEQLLEYFRQNIENTFH